MIRYLTDFFFPERGVLRASAYALIAAVGLSLGLGLSLWSVGQRVEWSLYDRMVSVASRGASPAPDIVVVAIDELSITELGLPLPWPRTLHAALIDSLVQGGAGTIVLDLLFDLPSTTEQDAALVAAVRRAGNVILVAQREDVRDRNYSIAQWVEPLPDLLQAAAGVGVGRVELDPDGVMRRTPLSVDGRAVLALAAARARPDFEAPPDLETAPLIRFNGPPRRGIRTVSYYQALEPGIFLPPDVFRNKTVLIGFSLAAPLADGAAVDHFASPVHPQMSGVEIQATLLDTLVRDRAVADPLGARGPQVVYCAVLGGLAGLLLFRVGPLVGLAGTLGLWGVLLVVGYQGLAAFGLRTPVLSPALSVAGLYATTAAFRFGVGQRERRFIKRAFQHYISPKVVEQILSDPSKLKLGGEEYDVTILFTDLADFTSISERLTPQELTTVLSDYFGEMTDILLAEGATLDKFIGDAIMAFFGCPIRDSDHAEGACRAAIGMRDRLDGLNRRRRGQGFPELRMRVGLNSGRVVAGNIGTDQIFNYTVMGDAVNLASRLEGVNKEYGTSIIISDATCARARSQIEVRELDVVRAKGKAQQTAIWELAALKGGLAPERGEVFERFGVGLALYRNRHWSEARAAFQRALEIDGADGPSGRFIRRCNSYSDDPPPPNWDRVHVMTSK